MTTKEKISAVALELFAQKGYHDTKMSEIAAKAKLGKGTLYWHFKSKNDLFTAVIDQAIQDYFIFLEKIQKKPYNSKEKLNAIIDYRLHYAFRDLKLQQVFLHSYHQFDSKTKNNLIQQKQQNEQIIKHILIEGCNNQEFIIKNPSLAALLFSNLINTLLLDCAFTESNSPAELSEQLKELIFCGLNGSKNIKEGLSL